MGFEAWRRVPEAGACSWCLMLATRGAVYASKTTAETARGAGKYHRRCRCTAELEARYDRRTDIRTTPEDAARTVTIRNDGRAAAYNLARYRNLGVTDPPLPAWATPRLNIVGRMLTAAAKPVVPPSVPELIARQQVKVGWTAWDTGPKREREVNRRIAARLLIEHAITVRAVDPVDGKFGPSPDAIFDDESRTIEFKDSAKATKNALRLLVRYGRRQSRNLILDVSSAGVGRAKTEALVEAIVEEYDGDIDSLLLLGRGWHSFVRRWQP